MVYNFCNNQGVRKGIKVASPNDTNVSNPSPPQSITLTPLETPATILTVGGIGGSNSSKTTTIQEVLIISTNTLLPQQQQTQQPQPTHQIVRAPAARDISSTGGVMTGC